MDSTTSLGHIGGFRGGNNNRYRHHSRNWMGHHMYGMNIGGSMIDHGTNNGRSNHHMTLTQRNGQDGAVGGTKSQSEQDYASGELYRWKE